MTSPQPISIFRACLPFLVELQRTNAHYIVIGSLAMAFQGMSRFTRDLDVLVKPDEENGSKVRRALQVLGVPIQKLPPSSFTKPFQQFSWPLGHFYIDIITAAHGLTFEEAWNDSCEVEFEGVKIHALQLTGIIKNKKAVGRPQDLTDIVQLEKFLSRNASQLIG